MIQLAFVRHAHADQGGPDHDRPLSARGERDAAEVAKRVLRTGVRSEAVLSSTAARARATAEAFAAAFGAEVVEHADLYGAPPETILEAARANGAAELTIVAHDPGMSELVSELADEEVNLTTGAVAVFTWNGSWDDVGVLPPDDYTLTTP